MEEKKETPLKAAFTWDELKLNSDGMVCVVVQDDKNKDVLMVAYMNRQAYEKTIETGVMTYWSRSRNELWVKGLTSGHFQYVRSLYLDCDNDTILARVDQSRRSLPYWKPQLLFTSDNVRRKTVGDCLDKTGLNRVKLHKNSYGCFMLIV
ncbi:MAG: phosphoribosyl-AMP cyclohydrolase [Lachnospiraceae bacterium]